MAPYIEIEFGLPDARAIFSSVNEDGETTTAAQIHYQGNIEISTKGSVVTGAKPSHILPFGEQDVVTITPDRYGEVLVNDEPVQYIELTRGSKKILINN